MARAYEALYRKVTVSKFVTSLLLLSVSLWTAIYASSSDLFPSWLTNGFCIAIVAIGLYGLWRQKVTAFFTSGLMLVSVFSVLAITIFSVHTIEQALAPLSLLLLVIYFTELGNLSIFFNEFVHKMVEPTSEVIIMQTNKVFHRCLIRLTGIVATAFFLSFFLLFLGAAVAITLENIYATAIAVVTLLICLVLLGTLRVEE